MQAEELEELNRDRTEHARVTALPSAPFGPRLVIQRYQLGNGLTVLLCEDHSAKVVAYHTWYRVGSRHERPGKTGLAHLFEHLMFNETEQLAKGEFDRRLMQAGAESNASTWLDWTHYTIAVPSDQLGLVVGLEAERMAHLVLRAPELASEKEVVLNERRFRVDDDVDGRLNEALWGAALTRHPYRSPTIGSAEDIQGFTVEDCEAFYRAYYAPNNACVVVVGDARPLDLLRLVSDAYGALTPSTISPEDTWPEPPQLEARELTLTLPTPTLKLALAYHAPAMGDADHPALALLSEILTGGRASRLTHRLITQGELASDVRSFLGPLKDPSLFEIAITAREGVASAPILAIVSEELARLQAELVSQAELDRALARFELGLVSGLESVEGKASTIGLYEIVLGQPGAAFERLAAMRRVTPSDLRWAARRYLGAHQRTLIEVVPDESLLGEAPDEPASSEGAASSEPGERARDAAAREAS
ncbi:MAG: insulinase family protein [Polyangiaceae bacterium]|nr:insulinase family protein [Polyangiaceae bacterium]